MFVAPLKQISSKRFLKYLNPSNDGLFFNNISTPRTVQGYPWGGGTSTFISADDFVPSVFATLSPRTPTSHVAPRPVGYVKIIPEFFGESYESSF